MNANELADWIKDTEFYDNSDPNINDRMDEVEVMLRQQQAEIEVLKAKTLTDEDIIEVWRENERVYPLDRSRLLDRTRACIRKAQEK